jgi:hypothetical protein
MAKKLTKQEAVRRALQHFGNDAKPAQMRPWIRQELGIDMSPDHISTAKGDILRKAGVKKPAKAASQTAPTKKEVSTSAPRATSIPLDDILYIKSLVGRVGPDSLHKLIDAFAK